MIFIIVSVVIPLLVYWGLPKLLGLLTGKSFQLSSILAVAGIIFFVSWYLPSPLIYGQNTQFTTHFVGGGVFTGFVWYYLYSVLRLRLSVIAQAASLYALVCTLGVSNELFELAITQGNLVHISGADTWWDLLANTLGALCFFVFLLLARRFFPRLEKTLTSRIHIEHS